MDIPVFVMGFPNGGPLIDPITMLQEGGPFMMVILGISTLGTPVAVLTALAIGASRKALPASAGWILITFGALFGLIGTYLGVSNTQQAILGAAPEMRQALMAQGISISMYTTAGWLMLSIPGFLAVTWTAWLPAILAPGPDRTLDLPALGAATAGAFVGLLLSIGITLGAVGTTDFWMARPISILAPPLALASLFPVALASLRVSTEPAHKARIAATRVLLGTSAFLAVGLLGELFRIFGLVLTFQAIANAAPDTKQQLLHEGVKIAGYARWIGWGSALIPALAGWLGGLIHAQHFGSRQGIGAVIAGVQVTILLGAVIAASYLMIPPGLLE